MKILVYVLLSIVGLIVIAFAALCLIGTSSFALAGRTAIAPKNSATGNALIANDPHLSFSEPANFYPVSIRVPGKLNVAGMSFPGAPFVISGQNERIAWGSTVHPMDVTDLYQEQFVPDATSPSGFNS